MFKKHLILPSLEPPNYYLSLSSYLVFKNGLCFFNALTWKSKIKKILLLLVFYIIKIKARLVGQQPPTNDKVKWFLTIIDRLKIDINKTNVYMPSYGKAIVQVLSDSGQCLKIAKIALDEDSGFELKVESDKLRFLNKLSFNTFGIPRVLNEGYLDSLYYANHNCPASYVPMEYLDHSGKMISILVELFQRPGISQRLVNKTDFFDRIIKNINKVTDKNTEELLNKVTQFYYDESLHYKVPLGIVHGDFKPWNLLINKETNKLFILDWAGMSEEGFPLWDAFSYTIYTFFVLRYTVTPQKAYGAFLSYKDFFFEYCRRLDIDVSLVKNLLPLYLADLLSSDEMWERWEKNEKRPAKIAQSIKDFLQFLVFEKKY